MQISESDLYPDILMLAADKIYPNLAPAVYAHGKALLCKTKKNSNQLKSFKKKLDFGLQLLNF